jgi:hypothetical protein
MKAISPFSPPIASKDNSTDQYGTIVSKYAPIDDDLHGLGGNTYAVLGINMEAGDYAAKVNAMKIPPYGIL